MKTMVVSGQKALRMSITRVLETSMDDFQVIPADHENALVTFLDEDPEAVLICEYSEKGSGEEWDKGRATFKDISGSADEAVRIIRIGFDEYPYDDYLKAPFELSELIKKLNHG